MIRLTSILYIVLTELLLLPCIVLAQQTDRSADLVLTDGQIYTPDGWVEAIGIKDGVIIAVGSNTQVNHFRNQTTETISLDGSTVLPGLHDMHVHPMGAGLNQQQCNFPQGSSREQLLAVVKACADQRSPGDWIVGGQWDASSFGNMPMHRSMLDEVAPDNPVSLVDISGHSIWVNSRALELAGITADSTAPPGGVIERDARGRPSGVLRESASGLVRRLIPPPTAEQSMQALKWSLEQMLSHGITSFTDAGVNGVTMQAYADLADRGLLKQRVRACMMMFGLAFGGSNSGIPPYIEQRNLYARVRFSPDCIKLVLDGVPTDGHTAAMVEPYENTEDLDAAEAKGLLMIPQRQLNAIVTDADTHGLVVKMHAAGDAAVRAGLNAIAAAREANGFSGRLHNVAHNSFVQMDDIDRARGLAATFEMSPYIWYPNPIIPDIKKAVGEKRMQRWIPVKDAIDAGALVVPGSDWPVVPFANPWTAIETLVTRQQPGGGGETLGAAERITLKQAIDMFTVNAARQFGHRDSIGTIETGMLADLVVLDRNPFKIPITEVHNTQVKMVLIEGEIVLSTDPDKLQ